MFFALIDYGGGNLTSVAKALTAVGATPRVVTAAADLTGARAIVVPGVGHFGATAALDAGWHRAIHAAITDGTPVLGICLGLQWLFDGSDEAETVSGLGLLRGRCFLLDGDVKVPHVGWNTIDRTAPSRLLSGIDERASAYFTHSFAAPLADATAGTTTHGRTFTSVVERDRVFGVQFHPEKSGTTGLRVLENFRDVVKEVR
jgi:imidazole glycerol-phosphate synthase subunit HisH